MSSVFDFRQRRSRKSVIVIERGTMSSEGRNRMSSVLDFRHKVNPSEVIFALNLQRLI